MRRLRTPKAILLACALVAVASVVAAASLIARTEQNREAIEVGCLLVVQVVRDSGANSGKPRDTPAGQAQARISAAYAAAVLRLMRPKERRAVVRDREIVRRAGGSIPEPQCADVASDPSKVRRDTLQKRNHR